MREYPYDPLFVTGKTQEGKEFKIDVNLLLATDSMFRETFAKALQRLLDTGFAVDGSLSIAVLLSEAFDDGGSDTIVQFPREQWGTHLAEHVSDYVIDT